ncbi:MAG: phytanoyl-CoA dioxygenase family protein [Phycisphaeraceae bacterium]|nr:phytanoyl-CoA dioxygenase family protein [Phycisphaeraceae bacterium]
MIRHAAASPRLSKNPKTPETPAMSTAAEMKIPVKPAASVWRGPDPVNLDEQVRFFHENGFVILRNVIGKPELDELDRELNRLAEQHATLPHIREGYNLEPRQDASRRTPTFRKIGGITDLSPAFNQLMRHPRVVASLHAIMGKSIYLYRDVVMMKPARVGREKPWHQDSVYWPWEPMQLVSAMTALDDASPENGCLQVIPATHHESVQHYGQELQIDIDDAMQAKTVYVPLKAGDTLLFHSLLLHGSEPNTSAQDRRVIIVSYRPDGLNFIGKGQREPDIVVSRQA